MDVAPYFFLSSFEHIFCLDPQGAMDKVKFI